MAKRCSTRRGAQLDYGIAESLNRAFRAAAFSINKILGRFPQAANDDAPLALQAIRIAD